MIDAPPFATRVINRHCEKIAQRKRWYIYPVYIYIYVEGDSLVKFGQCVK